MLLGVGLYFTVYLGFPQLRYFRHAWAVVAGRFDRPGAPGDASHFQALSTALSGTVGTGNIGGVGLAIFIGGPAALFWMWMTAFLGMTTKMVEVTLSHKYRVVSDNGTMSGGPMYFMERRLNLRPMALFFAVATVISAFGTGSLPQINNIAQSVNASFGIQPMVTGAVLTVLLALVIVGGIHRIAKVASMLVPLMAFIYVVGAISVILSNLGNIIPSLLMVVGDVFTGTSATGGFLGASFAYAFNRGVNRGLFSNEAGQGSAAIAHAAARTDEPVAEGMVALLEPFIDTIVICTLTGLVILSSGAWTQKFENDFQRSDLMIVAGQFSQQSKPDVEALSSWYAGSNDSGVQPFSGVIPVQDGIAMVGDAFTVLHARSLAEEVVYLQNGAPFSGELEIVAGQPTDPQVSLRGKSLLHSAALTTRAFSFGIFGENGGYIVTLSLVLFAFSTAIAWSYYGDRAMIFMFGSSAVVPYRVVYCIGFFVASFADTTLVWNFAAIGMVVMAIPNLLGLLLLRREMKDAISRYKTRL
ncbi:MAG: alanine/glycine:cation symporter family protein [Pseudohongiellaceae bacterium]